MSENVFFCPICLRKFRKWELIETQSPELLIHYDMGNIYHRVQPDVHPPQEKDCDLCKGYGWRFFNDGKRVTKVECTKCKGSGVELK